MEHEQGDSPDYCAFCGLVKRSWPYESKCAEAAMLREALGKAEEAMQSAWYELQPTKEPFYQFITQPDMDKRLETVRTALAASSDDWLKRHDAEIVARCQQTEAGDMAELREERDAYKVLVDAGTAACAEVDERCAAQLAALREERDGLAALGLTWQPIEKFDKQRHEGNLILLLKETGGIKLLRTLPWDYSYDFKDREETYYKASLFTHWMPMPSDPGSENWNNYAAILADRDARIRAEVQDETRRAVKAERELDNA